MTEREILSRWLRGEYREMIQQPWYDPPVNPIDESLFRSGRATWEVCGHRQRRAVTTDLGALALRVCPVLP
jgi:hypothetical protein